jgi:hypothetical protein
MSGIINFVPTGSWEIVKQPQFVEEEVFGELELDGCNWQNIGIVTEIGMEVSIEEDIIRILGMRDIYEQVKLGVNYAFAMRYRPQGTRYMKYGIDLPNRSIVPDHTMAAPNGTNFASQTILLTAYIDGVEKARIYTGVKTASISIAVNRESPGIECTQNFLCKEISDWITIPSFTNNTYAGAITGVPWSGITSGVDPFTLGGEVVQVPGITLDVNQGLAQLKPTGIESLYYLAPTNRTITYSFETWTKGSSQIQKTRNHDNLALTYLLAPGALASGTGAKHNSYSSTLVGGSEEFLKETVGGNLKTLSIPLV